MCASSTSSFRSPRFHERAFPAALASDCAGQQGKFWEMHDLLMRGDLSDEALVGYARALGLQ